MNLHLVESQSGERPITDHSLKEFRQSIGVVSQEPVCFFLIFVFILFTND